MLNYSVKEFDRLSLRELHDMIRLRIDVFVVEQDCPYSELDGRDPQCLHVLGKDADGRILAVARIVPPGLAYDVPAIGRVVVSEVCRGTGEGHRLMEVALDATREHFGTGHPILLSAQEHLEAFYQSHGFSSTGKRYLEDGIPHVQMSYGGVPKEEKS